ncbi:cytochrome P450 [Streptomyces jumonjinensis]|uniref:cytochrome P450 n=1 Tax=Streptomyces jumonjinensis TaxID=1945 RepID=UPI003789EC94
MTQATAHHGFPFVRDAGAAHDPDGERLMRDAPVVRAQLPDGTPIRVALTLRACRQVLTDPVFSRRAALEPGAPQVAPGLALPSMLTSMDGEDHARTRRLITRAFTPRLVEGMRPWITDLVNELLDTAERRPGPVDLVEQLTLPLPVKVICRLLGVPYEDQDRFRGWTDALLSHGGSAEQVREAYGRIQEYLRELTAAKREHPGEDLTSALTRVSDETGQLPEEHLVNNLQLVLVAGHDTTLNQLSNSLIALLAERERYALLCARPELVDNAVEELLRHLLLTRAGTLIRVATKDTELGGTTIRAGEGVIALQHVANRDPEGFADPDRLDLARTDTTGHLAFGAGPHFCVGAQLARLEMSTALSLVTRRFPAMRLAVPAGSLRWKENSLVRGPETLPVTLT